MRKTIPALLISAAGVLLVVQAFPAQAQDDRIRDLERRVEQLEKRLSTTTTRSNEEKGGTGGAGGWRSKANWRLLARGMPDSEVQSIIGEPQKVDVNQFFITWYWNYPTGPSARFTTNDRRLDAWSEP